MKRALAILFLFTVLGCAATLPNQWECTKACRAANADLVFASTNPFTNEGKLTCQCSRIIVLEKE